MSAEKIVIALDCAPDEALRLAQVLKGQATWLKVGMTLYYAAGPAIVSRLGEMGFKVFVDLKLHDIPHQVSKAAAALVYAGADMLTLHCFGGAAMLAAGEAGAQDAAAKLGKDKPLTLGVTVLTSLDASDLTSIGVVAAAPAAQVLRLAALAQQAGLSGVVASPQEARVLREALGARAAIVTPGIRPAAAISQSARFAVTPAEASDDQGHVTGSAEALDGQKRVTGSAGVSDGQKRVATPAGTPGDQKRVATPAAALADGASHLVIGRPVTAAPDPAAAFVDIVASLP